MADFLEQGFVVDNQCAVTVHSDIVVVSGDIACLGSIDDSPHDHLPHPHKHIYDTFGSGHETQVITLRKESDVPTLGEVIRELQEWHLMNAGKLSARHTNRARQPSRANTLR